MCILLAYVSWLASFRSHASVIPARGAVLPWRDVAADVRVAITLLVLVSSVSFLKMICCFASRECSNKKYTVSFRLYILLRSQA